MENTIMLPSPRFPGMESGLRGDGMAGDLGMATLCLLDENGITARRWELGDKPIAVGRDKSADVVIEDAALSRRHFVVQRDGVDYLLKDLDSQNGTWVDGQRARSTRLRHHDCILAGRTIFLFSERAAGAPKVPSPAPQARSLP